MMIKYNTLYKYSIYIILFLNLGFLSFIDQMSTLTPFFSIILTIFLVCIYFFQHKKRKIYDKSILIYMCLVLFIFIIQLLRWHYLNASYLLTDIKVIINQYGMILVVFLALPIYEALREKNFLRNIVILGYLALLFRVILWLFYNFTPLIPHSYLIKGSSFTRPLFGMNLLRIQGTFLDPVLLIFSLSYIFKKNIGKGRKILYFILASFVLLYSVIISQYRINILALSIIYFIVLYININKKNSWNKFILLFLLIVLLFFAQNTLHDFVNSFSINNESTGASTLTRLDGFPYFMSELKNASLFLGMGFVAFQLQTLNGIFWFSDYGIIAELFRFGIIGLVIYAYPFIKGLICSVKYRKYTFDIFIIGITIYYIITSVTIDPMESSNILLLPLFLSFLLEIKFLNITKKNE